MGSIAVEDIDLMKGRPVYQAIVFLPLLGFVIAGLISLAVAHARFPGGPPAPSPPSSARGRAMLAPSPHPWAARVLDASMRSGRAAAAGRRFACLSELVTTVFLFASMLLSWFAFVDVGFGHHDSHGAIFPWMTSGDLKVDWALRIDTLTASCWSSSPPSRRFVHLYSIGYMEEDPYRPRFFSYLSLFTFAMLMLVTADNLVQLFFGWEGVG